MTSKDAAIAQHSHPRSLSSSLIQLLFIPFQLVLFIAHSLGLDMAPAPKNVHATSRIARGNIVKITPSRPALLRLRPTGGNSVNGTRQEERTSTLNEWIAENVGSLKGSFKPAWWLPNGHLQTFFTVIGDFTKVDPVHYVRTYLRLPDGGTIGIDIAPENHDQLPADAPTVVVSHGLTGGSHESYVRNILAWVIRPKSEGGLGGRGVVVNSRGCAGVPITSCQLYSAATTMDLALALHHIRNRHPDSPLHGIGFSLGASIMSRYLGEAGSGSILSSAVVLGCPWDLKAGSKQLETPWFTSHVYSSALGQNILRLFFNAYERNPAAFDGENRYVKNALPELRALKRSGGKARLKRVDDLITSQIGGPTGIGAWPFDDAMGYYRWGSAKRLLHNVKVPLLALNAFDDPVVATTTLPLAEMQGSSHVFVAVTGSGGHLGWFNGPIRGAGSKRRWVLEPVSEYITAASRDLAPTPKIEVEQDEGDGWEWVKDGDVAHDIPGVKRVGWKVLKEGEVVEGESGSGVMQGL